MDKNKTYEELERSLFHALSHKGEEVSHSDFLCYLAQEKKSLFKDFLKKLDLPNDYEKVETEWHNMDLVFFKDKAKKPFLVIENKVKSLPDDFQIETYRKKAPNAEFVFFTFFDSLKAVKTRKIFYSQIIDILKKLKNKQECSQHDIIDALLEDYIKYVGNFQEIVEDFIPADEELKKLSVKDYFLKDKKNSKIKLIKDLKLESLIKKIRMSKLEYFFKCKIDENNIFDIKIDDIKDKSKINIKSTMSNGKPLLIFEMLIKEDKPDSYFYFVHFDNGVLNHGIIVETKDGKLITIADKKEKPLLRRELLKNVRDSKVLAHIDDLLEKIGNNGENVLGYNNVLYTHINPQGKEQKEFEKKSIEKAIGQIINEIRNIQEKLKNEQI